MFVTSDQPRIIVVCFFIGCLIGVYYELFYFIKLFFKNKLVKHIINSLWGASSSIIFTYVSFVYRFENFRMYMFLVSSILAIVF